MTSYLQELLMKIEKYSFGVGDRFARQGKAQLAAMIEAAKLGTEVVPVWNKSFREHSIVHTEPASTRREADEAVSALGWHKGYYADADHINMSNVAGFTAHCDFFTLDVADYIGESAAQADIDAFVAKYSSFAGELVIDGIEEPLIITRQQIRDIASKTLLAVQKAGEIYRFIEGEKGAGNFVTEVSMDETELAQQPVEILFILAAISDEGICAQTIAPKFTGRFNKGVDYVGDVSVFDKEFNDDLAVIRYAVGRFGLPENLKLSVHSGSDKFSIYPVISAAIKRFDAGLHIKTAGTTWLEEIIGLAAAGGEGLEIAKMVYCRALERFDELCGPYAAVIDIDKSKLPSAEAVNEWTSDEFKYTLTHNPSCPKYNLHARQLIHVGYKVAAELGAEYLEAVEKYEGLIAQHVTYNILERHIKPLFLS